MKRLYRSRRNAVIGGVCAGISDYFGVDPTIVRLIWAATILLGGTGLIAYILAWLVIPPAPENGFNGDRMRFEPVPQGPPQTDREIPADSAPETQVARPEPGRERHGLSGPSTLGLILIVLGAFLLARNLVPGLHLQRYWPLAVIGVGIWLILNAVRGDR